MTEQRKQLFDQLKRILVPYEKQLMVTDNFDTRYSLVFDKEYEVTSERTGKTTKKHGLYFAGIIIQSSYVGFYFMPYYAQPKEFSLSPVLKNMLKGKSCFHIKALDEKLVKEIEKMVKVGFRLFDRM